MANNRMYLVCMLCARDPDKPAWDDFAFFLAKYYPRPDMRWFNPANNTQAKEAWFDRFEKFLDAHYHGTPTGADFGLIYESWTEFGRGKQRIVDSIQSQLNRIEQGGGTPLNP